MREKESTVASVLAIIFTVLLVFILMACSSAFYIEHVFLNSKNLFKILDFGGIAMDYKEELLGDDAYPGHEEAEELYDVVFESEFTNLIFAEYYDAALYGDDEVDRDAIKDTIEPVVEDFADEHPELEMDDIDKDIDALLDDLEEDVGTIAYSGESQEIQFAMKQAKKSVDYTFYGTLIVSVIMIGVLLILYKNKYRPFFYLGLSLTISQGLNFVGALGVYGLFRLAVSEAYNSQDPEGKIIDDILTKFVNGFAKEAFMIFGLLLVIGIALIVCSNILTKNMNAIEDIE